MATAIEDAKCFVCKHVTRENRPVRFVLRGHKAESIQWHFVCGDDHPPGTESWEVATVGDVLSKDASLRSVLDLPFHWEAERQPSGEWARRDYFVSTMLESIEKHGFYVVSVLAEGALPGFVFTVGLWKSRRHPELLMTGGTLERMAGIVGGLAERIVSGLDMLNDGLILRDAPRALAFLKVLPRHYEEWLGAALGYYGGDAFDVLQVVMADPSGRFPWERGVEKMYVKLQPLLGSPPRG